jgi:formylglycine-generating enzyme required for sulfatase activity
MIRNLSLLCAFVTPFVCAAQTTSESSKWKAERLPSEAISFRNLVVAKASPDKLGLMLLVPKYDAKSKAMKEQRLTAPLTAVRAWRITGESLDNATLLQQLAESSHVFAVEMTESAKFTGISTYHASILRPDSIVLYLSPNTMMGDNEPPASAAGTIRDDNFLKLKLVRCSPGSFLMGSPRDNNSREENEDDTEGDGGKQVKVEITKGFWIGQTEITQKQWIEAMKTRPWRKENGGLRDFVKEGDAIAASCISYDDAIAFCKKVTARERSAGRLSEGESYSLPTEAQWEYACRAGTSTRYSFGNDEGKLGEYAWWGGLIGSGNASLEKYTHNVAQKKPNPWTLYDMHGNCSEWCLDAYSGKLLGGHDPYNTIHGDRREFVHRGGSWVALPGKLRSTQRTANSATYDDFFLGFRIVLAHTPQTADKSDVKDFSDKWEEFTSEDTSFSVKFPAKQKTKVEVLSSGNRFTMGANGESAFFVAQKAPAPLRLSKAAKQEFLEAMRDRHVAEIKGGKLTREKEITFDGFPGLEFTIEGENPLSPDPDPEIVIIRTRMILVGEYIYDLFVVPYTKEFDSSSVTNSFFKSFKLKE